MARRRSGKARQYHLSVRLSKEEVKQYLRMLEYYGVLDKTLTMAQRFRELLGDFEASLEWLKNPGEYVVWEYEDGKLEAMFHPPPDWRRHGIKVDRYESPW